MESPDIYNTLPQCNLSVNIHDRCTNCGDCWTAKQRRDYEKEHQEYLKLRAYQEKKSKVKVFKKPSKTVQISLGVV